MDIGDIIELLTATRGPMRQIKFFQGWLTKYLYLKGASPAVHPKPAYAEVYKLVEQCDDQIQALIVEVEDIGLNGRSVPRAMKVGFNGHLRYVNDSLLLVEKAVGEMDRGEFVDKYQDNAKIQVWDRLAKCLKVLQNLNHNISSYR